MIKVISACAFLALSSSVFALPNLGGYGGMLAIPSGQATAKAHRAEMLVEQKAAAQAAFDRAARSYACTREKTAGAASTKRTSTCS